MTESLPNVFIPADVPVSARDIYTENYRLITKNTDNIVLFAGDQKIEHLNKDFYGSGIDPDAIHPEHLFEIAQKSPIGAFATHLGLIARWGILYPGINYIVKLNAKTDLIPIQAKDPLSTLLWNVQDVINFKNESNLSICGIGYTLYLGSAYEHLMLHEAAQVIYQAHQHGLLAILWMYPRGQHVPYDRDPKVIAGAAGVGHALGADFIKLHAPQSTTTQKSVELLKIVTQAAGNSKVICAGGKAVAPEFFLEELYDQLAIGRTSGCATGRNIFQHSLLEAVALAKAIGALVYDKKSFSEALDIYKSEIRQI